MLPAIQTAQTKRASTEDALAGKSLNTISESAALQWLELSEVLEST